MARQILSQGEVHMQAQLDVAIAADQRATTASSLFASIAAATTAATLAYWDKSGDLPILIAGISGSAAMGIGAIITLRAANPVDFYLPGNHPRNWYDCRFEPIPAMLGAEAENYQYRIDRNRDVLLANAATFKQGTTLAVAAPLLALGVWVLTQVLIYFS
jgi:hypothetical protein